MIEDFQLTDSFSLYDMTKTTHAEFQERNREVTIEQIVKLTALARLLEHIHYVLEAPLIITSAYRCKPLNDFLGSKDTSQHLLCEAADFIPKDKDLGKCFRLLWVDIKVNGANVGQLIHENDNNKEWIHCSLGRPYRAKEKCEQILKFENKKYTLLA